MIIIIMEKCTSHQNGAKTQPIAERVFPQLDHCWLQHFATFCSLTEPQPLHLAVVQDMYQFCAVALLFQACFFMLYIARAGRQPESARVTIDRVLDVFVAAVPPAAPAVVVAALAYCSLHLRRGSIEVLVPEKIKTIADVEVVCFDKTGTLTGTVVSPLCLPFGLCKLPFSTSLMRPQLRPLVPPFSAVRAIVFQELCPNSL